MRSRRASVPVAEAELVVLKALWDGGPATVRELQQRDAAVGGWAYTTVQTLLQRLSDKGLVKADKRDLAHVFAAAVSREQLAGERVQEVADSLLDGALAPLLLRLLPNGRFSADEISRFRTLLDAAEARAQKRRRPREDA
jgi:predicted transcriptional regulator